MQSSHSLSRLSVAFCDPHAVADAGLLLPATLAEKGRVLSSGVRIEIAPSSGSMLQLAMSRGTTSSSTSQAIVGASMALASDSWLM